MMVDLAELVCDRLNARVLGTEFRVLEVAVKGGRVEGWIFSDGMVGVGSGSRDRGSGRRDRRVRVSVGFSTVRVDLFSSSSFSSPTVWRVFGVADPDFYDRVVGFVLDGYNKGVLASNEGSPPRMFSGH